MTGTIRTVDLAVAVPASFARSFLATVSDLGRASLAHSFSLERLVFLSVLNVATALVARHRYLL